MCGILGGSNTKWDYNAGIESMHHRGPDGAKIVKKNGFVLAFTRLSIMDLSENGMQPMFSEDGKVGIVYNGEIYGYQKLKDCLLKKGYCFNSSSDTEVILNSYLEWGDSFIDKIDGMFGMAIYDEREKVIKLYRDRAGIKPVYYYYSGKDFGFSSELKGILNMCKGKTFATDNTAVYDYLNYSYIPAPKTMYKNIYKLEPAHTVIYNMEKKRIVDNRNYWRLKVNCSEEKRRKQSELVEELRYLIKESVEEQMIADVPVGTFLSGGIDSSVVSYESSRNNPKIETFSIGFFDKRFDELQYAKRLIEKYGLLTNQRIFKKSDMEPLYDRLYEWYDEPFADTSAFPTYLVSALAKEKVVVALTGDGGDEVFGGYPRYTALARRKRNGFDNMLISRLFQIANKSGIFNEWKGIFLDDLKFIYSTYDEVLAVSDSDLRKKLCIPKDYDMLWHMRKYYVKDLPPITRGQYLDFKTYLPEEVLTKVDRASMAVSLETRVPFLSRKIIEFSFGISQEDRCPKGELKGLLKKVYVNELGREIVYRKKQGFCVPTEYIARQESAREKILRITWRIA